MKIRRAVESVSFSNENNVPNFPRYFVVTASDLELSNTLSLQCKGVSKAELAKSRRQESFAMALYSFKGHLNYRLLEHLLWIIGLIHQYQPLHTALSTPVEVSSDIANFATLII